MSAGEKAGAKRFAGDFGFKAMTELLGSLLGLYVFALFSRLFGTGGGYAVLNQTIAMSSLVVPLLLVRMNTALCVFAPGDKDQSRVRSRFMFVMLVTVGVDALLMAAAYLFAEPLAVLLWDNTGYKELLPPMAGYFSVMALSNLCQSFLQATGHQKKSNVFLLIRNFADAVGFTVLVVSPLTAAWTEQRMLKAALYIYLVVAAAVLVIQFAVLLWDWRGVHVCLRPEIVKPMYAYALPLLPVTVMTWVNSFIGRFLLNHLIDDELRSASIYGFYDSLTSRAFLINAVLVYTVFPYIAKAWNQHDRPAVLAYLNKSFNIGLAVGLPVILGLTLVCPSVIHWVADSNYPVDRTLLLVLCLAQLFQMLYMNFSYLIDLSRRTRWFNGIFLLSSVTNVVLCVVLIPQIGIRGSGIALMCAYALQLIVAAFISHEVADIWILPDILQAAKAVLSACVMYFVCHAIYLRGGTEPVGGAWNLALTVLAGVAVYTGCQWLLSKLTRTKLI